MANRISGPGVPLSPPTNLYPTELFNVPYDFGTNRVLLSPGDAVNIPAGNWLVNPGAYSLLQYQDPLTNSWLSAPAQRGQDIPIFSNGSSTIRIANLTGCALGAYVANGGSNYVQSSTTITANVGNSTWQAIVGGSLGVQSITNAGASFTFPGIVMIPDPPTQASNGVGGVPATAYMSLTNGTVSGVTMGQVGAGYVQATVTGLLLPSPLDPNYGTASIGTVTFTLTNAGAITAALPTNNGGSLASVSALTLTVAGAGASATVTPLILQTITATSIVAGGAGWGTASVPAKVTTVGGGGTVGAISNPTVDFSGFRPRDADITATCNAGGTITTLSVLDSGLFVSSPTPSIATGGTLPTTLASLTFTMGGVRDTVFMQPYP